MHSCHSDGILSGAELIALAAQRNVECLSITDHDAISVYADILDNPPEQLQIIVGCEFSSVWGATTVHIVGLNLDLNSSVLKEAMQIQNSARIMRSESIAANLEKRGFAGALEGAKTIAGQASIGRPHFARFLIDNGHAKDHKQAFKKYLGAGKIGDVKAQWQPIEQICRWIADAGGVAVLAHPLKYKLTQTKLKCLVQDFKQAGGQAIEVISGFQPTDKTRIISKLADEFDLYASVGSDFHQPGQPWADLGMIPDLPKQCRPVWDLWL